MKHLNIITDMKTIRELSTASLWSNNGQKFESYRDPGIGVLS